LCSFKHWTTKYNYFHQINNQFSFEYLSIHTYLYYKDVASKVVNYITWNRSHFLEYSTYYSYSHLPHYLVYIFSNILIASFLIFVYTFIKLWIQCLLFNDFYIFIKFQVILFSYYKFITIELFYPKKLTLLDLKNFIVCTDANVQVYNEFL